MRLLTSRVYTYLLLLVTVIPIFNHKVITRRGGERDTRSRLAIIGFIVGNYLSMLQYVVIIEQ